MIRSGEGFLATGMRGPSSLAEWLISRNLILLTSSVTDWRSYEMPMHFEASLLPVTIWMSLRPATAEQRAMA
jgi:hypothetical protein